MRQIQGKLVLLRVSGEFELPRVQVIRVQLYVFAQGFINVFFFLFLDERNNRLFLSSKKKKKKTLMNPWTGTTATERLHLFQFLTFVFRFDQEFLTCFEEKLAERVRDDFDFTKTLTREGKISVQIFRKEIFWCFIFISFLCFRVIENSLSTTFILPFQ